MAPAKLLTAAVSFMLVAIESPRAQGAPAAAATKPALAVKPPITFETGDTWTQGEGRFRLYGVQACIRGTTYTDQQEQTQDCGAASIAMLASLFRTAPASCQPVGRASDGATFVVCAGSLQGQSLELGTAMIVSGFAFAAVTPDGRPVHPPYLVAELQAKTARAGLWAAPDLPHPVHLVLRSLPGQAPRR